MKYVEYFLGKKQSSEIDLSLIVDKEQKIIKQVFFLILLFSVYFGR